MLDNGVPPNVYTFNMIIHSLCKESKIREAFRLFEEIGKRGLFPSVVTFNTLINGHCNKGNLVRLGDVVQRHLWKKKDL